MFGGGGVRSKIGQEEARERVARDGMRTEGEARVPKANYIRLGQLGSNST